MKTVPFLFPELTLPKTAFMLPDPCAFSFGLRLDGFIISRTVLLLEIREVALLGPEKQPGENKRPDDRKPDDGGVKRSVKTPRRRQPRVERNDNQKVCRQDMPGEPGFGDVKSEKQECRRRKEHVEKVSEMIGRKKCANGS